MAGRHSSAAGRRSRTLPVLLVLVVSAVVVAGGFGLAGSISKSDATDACDGSVDVRVAAAPEITPVLELATRDLESDGAAVRDVCVDYQVEASAPEQVAEVLATQPETAAHLWVPDFSVWVTRTAQAGATPATLSKSLAKTPVVVAGPDVEEPASWQEVGMGTVAYLDPLTSSASTAALLSAFGEMAVTGATETEMGAMMVPLAQRYGAQPDKPTTVEEVAQAAAEGGFGLMTEQQLAALQRDGKAQGYTATVPKSGTMVLDYPLAALSPEEFAREAGSQLAVHMAGSRGVELLADHGFRNAQNSPLDDQAGLGEVPVLPAPDAQAVTGALRQWAVLTVPSRMLAVVDVSGSMDFTDAGQSRISLAVAAASGALKLFPDNAQVGLWAFSVGLGGPNRDYTSLAPMRRLGAASASGTHRQALAGALRRLPRMTNGATGLYDSTLAAVRTVQDSYDPRAINTVVLLTDGENEDARSLTLRELIEAIQRERDPARPVQVVAVGMGPEADENALRKIAGATGGRAYVARDPSDISEVFIDAMLRR